MKKSILFILSLSIATLIIGQDSIIDVRNSFWSGTSYYQDSIKLEKSQVKKIVFNNSEAYSLLNKGMGQQTFGNVLGGIGGFLIGWPLGSALGGNDPKWYLAGIGAGFIVFGLPIYSNGTKNVETAIDMYNEELVGIKNPELSSYSVSIVSSNKGIGLIFSF